MNKAGLDAGRQFAIELLEDIMTGKIVKDCMINHSDEFTGGLEDLHRKRFQTYLSSCGCYLMDRRICKCEEGYSG